MQDRLASSRTGNPQRKAVTSTQTIGPNRRNYMHVKKTYYVYIMSSQRRVLYIGITSRIELRVRQHQSHTFGGFTAKYNVTNLVYFERYGSVGKAIRREKELKRWRREKKVELIEVRNPKWRDLSYGWYQVVLPKTLIKTTRRFRHVGYV